MARPTTTSNGWPLGTRPAGTAFSPLLTGTIKIMAVGDSITTDTYLSGAHRLLLKNRLDDMGLTTSWVGPVSGAGGLNHFGVSSATIQDVNAAIGAHLVTYAPHIVLLLIGRNNMTSDVDATAAPAAYATMLATMYAAQPVCRVIVGLTTPDETVAISDRTVTFRAALPAVVAASSYNGDGLARLSYAFKGLQPYSRAHQSDGTHPNAAGYGLGCDGFFPDLVNVIGSAASW